MAGSQNEAPFQLSGGHIALDFVNTLDNRFREDGPVELLGSYGDLLRFMQQSRLLSARQSGLLAGGVKKAAARRALQSALELREALAAVFYAGGEGASPPPAVIRKLEAYLLKASRQKELEWKQGRLTWRWACSEAEAELPVWMLALEAAELMTSESMNRVRTCGDETCRWLFLDTSKNHTRRWCNMKLCGNRMKARRFQAQRG